MGVQRLTFQFCYLFALITISLSFFSAFWEISSMFSSNLCTLFVSLFSKMLLGYWIFFLVMSFSFFMYVLSPVLPYLMSLCTCFLSVWNALPSYPCRSCSPTFFRSCFPWALFETAAHLLSSLSQHTLNLFLVFSFFYGMYYYLLIHCILNFLFIDCLLTGI